MTGAQKQEKDGGGDNALKALTRGFFYYALHHVMIIILIPVVIGSFFVIAIVVDAIQKILYRSMLASVVDAITPFIVCAVVMITWLVDGYIGYKIMILIKRAAGRK